MVKKNQTYELEIEDITYQGFGVAKLDGYTIFVEGALPTERVKAKVIKVTKQFSIAILVELLSASKDRVDVTDRVGYQIGTMPLQHLAYEAQLKLKRTMVVDVFKKALPAFDETIIQETLGMEHPWGYRNKAQIPVREIKGVVQTGFYRRNSHDLVPVDHFYIQEPEIDQALLMIRKVMNDHHIKAYDELTHTGDVRHVIVRRSHMNGALMLIFVTRTQAPLPTAFVEAIHTALPHTVSIIQNVNPDKTNVIMGRDDTVVWGQDTYRDQLLGKQFDISAQSFFQVNSRQIEVLYGKALEYAAVKPTDVVLDAYCGLGSITLQLADHSNFVYGVEIVPQAIEMAQRNAKLNHQENVEFICGAAEDVMRAWAETLKQFDVLVVDPPRKGLDDAFIEASLTAQPQTIVYVSCNPATCARDVAKYVESGYELKEITPVDMFPQTLHVETVVLMSRVDK